MRRAKGAFLTLMTDKLLASVDWCCKLLDVEQKRNEWITRVLDIEILFGRRSSRTPDSKLSDMDNYVRGKVLGKGSFGSAILVTSKADGKNYVIKEIDISKMPQAEREASKQEAQVILACMLCKHSLTDDEGVFLLFSCSWHFIILI
jgi:hypothetical protein